MAQAKAEKPAPAATGNGLLESDRLRALICSDATSPAPANQIAPPLMRLFESTCELVDRVRAGDLPFFDALDNACDLAQAQGLVPAFGGEIVEAVIGVAFIEHGDA